MEPGPVFSGVVFVYPEGRRRARHWENVREARADSLRGRAHERVLFDGARRVHVRSASSEGIASRILIIKAFLINVY